MIVSTVRLAALAAANAAFAGESRMTPLAASLTKGNTGRGGRPANDTEAVVDDDGLADEGGRASTGLRVPDIEECLALSALG